MNTPPLTLAEVILEELGFDSDPDLRKEFQADVDELKAQPIVTERLKKSEDLLRKIYEAIHAREADPSKSRTALCLSGGGVRSATFNLGVLQGLARNGLLSQFAYLSTVSGGGFIGGWLSAWIHRQEQGLTGVVKELSKGPDNPVNPEPATISYLRVFSNYLTPKKGLFSVDTWNLVAVYVRNLLLNWLVFLPPLIAFLMLPRFSIVLIRTEYLTSSLCLWVGFVSGVVALAYVGLSLPSTNLWNLGRNHFLWFCLAPLWISALGLTTYWARFQGEIPSQGSFIKFSWYLSAIPLGFFFIGRIVASKLGKSRPKLGSSQIPSQQDRLLNFLKYVFALALILGAFAATSAIVWFLVTGKYLFPLHLETAGLRLYATFAVPAVLLLMCFGATLIAGFTSVFTDVKDQEWWARSGAWILLLAVAWIAFHALVLFGPTLLTDLQGQLLNRSNWNLKTLATLKGGATAILGILSGAITLFGGFSASTKAKEGENGGTTNRTWVIVISGVVFAAFVAIVLSLVTDWLVASDFGNWISRALGGSQLQLDPSNPRGIIYNSPGGVLLALFALFAVSGALFGVVINTNRFSLHFYWRNRLMRAYLGASNQKSAANSTNKFTEFNEDDNLKMHDLQRQKPLHVFNMTLNLVGGKKLQWQDRKAESFSVTPYHAGSFWLGYRNSKEFADSISLATSMAISGAAASPNMGYMMTSPIVRFLMTLFNVRLGFWFGNPGEAGAKDYQKKSPTQSVRPIVSEALGLTDDESPYVYLSDGGHFENLGLYEMVLRRCRLIVVSDASTDTDYELDCLAMAIRQIRTDFGIPIDIEPLSFGPGPDKSHNYCAVGTIRYSCVDNKEGNPLNNSKYDGTLVYLKPCLLGDEPRDILTYHFSHSNFPEEPISDQWFSEAQFESYRALGNHMIEKICEMKAAVSNSGMSPLAKFAMQATAHASRTRT